MKSSVKPILNTVAFGMLFFFMALSHTSLAGDMHHQRVGMLTGAGGHNAEGSVNLEGHTLILSDLTVDKVPDGRVYLTTDADFTSGVELGRLTQFSGSVNYSIPDGVNPDDYNSVLIWCKKFSVEIGHANLNPVQK